MFQSTVAVGSVGQPEYLYPQMLQTADGTDLAYGNRLLLGFTPEKGGDRSRVLKANKKSTISFVYLLF